MKKIAFILLLVSSYSFAQGVPIKSGASSDLVTVNSNKSMHVVRGRSSAATYQCTATGLVTTAIYSMQLDAQVSRGFRIQKICVSTSPATAAALQTITVQRRTTASTGGTAATAEGATSPSVSKLDQAELAGNWGGRCAQTPTLGTAGAVVDGWSWVVGEIGAGTADGSGPQMFCKTYGDESEKSIAVTAGTTNGVSVSASAVGAGGLAAGAITIMFVAE